MYKIVEHNPSAPSMARTISIDQATSDAVREIVWSEIEKLKLDIEDQKKVGVRLLRSTSESIPNNTSTALSFTTDTDNTSNMWSALSPTEVVIRIRGTYLFIGACTWAASAVGLRRLTVFQGNSQAGEVTETPTAAVDSPQMIVAGTTRSVEVGEILTLRGLQTSGGPLNSTIARFAVYRLG